MANKYYFPQERISVLPLGVVDRSSKAKPQPVKEYYAQIPGCTEVAGCAVSEDKRVKLTAAQAQYWIDQGVIGEAAVEHKAGGLLEKPEKKAKK